MQAGTNLRKPVRVLIVDDHRMFAEALEAILATDGRIEIAGHAGTGEEAIDVARSARPDVVLARQAGAAGYVTKDRIAAELVGAILEVAKT